MLAGISPLHGGTMTFGTGDNQFDMTFVEIGNPGNADDTTGNPGTAGKVEYAYQMGKYEVSEDMIKKFNASQSLTITKNSRGLNKPATSVTWNEAARFVNWLNTSQGYQAAYNFTTSGVNDHIALWSSAEAWQLGGENLFRHKDAQYWLPSMDEWYKAAYYDPNSGNYFDYPTASDTIPTSVASGDGTGINGNNEAVYDQLASQGPADVTSAGGLSAYGVMGLGGNVSEWTETEFDLLNDDVSSGRGIRSGDWERISYNLSSMYWKKITYPDFGDKWIGFRVASLSSSSNAVPEPGSGLVWGLFGSAGFFVRRKRLRK